MRSVQALEDTINIMPIAVSINIPLVTVPLVKITKYLGLQGVGWGGSEGQKLMSTVMPLPKMGGGSVLLNGGIWYNEKKVKRFIHLCTLLCKHTFRQ